jgi:hypothetical protein
MEMSVIKMEPEERDQFNTMEFVSIKMEPLTEETQVASVESCEIKMEPEQVSAVENYIRTAPEKEEMILSYIDIEEHPLKEESSDHGISIFGAMSSLIRHCMIFFVQTLE